MTKTYTLISEGNPTFTFTPINGETLTEAVEEAVYICCEMTPCDRHFSVENLPARFDYYGVEFATLTYDGDHTFRLLDE